MDVEYTFSLSHFLSPGNTQSHSFINIVVQICLVVHMLNTVLHAQLYQWVTNKAEKLQSVADILIGRAFGRLRGLEMGIAGQQTGRMACQLKQLRPKEV